MLSLPSERTTIKQSKKSFHIFDDKGGNYERNWCRRRGKVVDLAGVAQSCLLRPFILRDSIAVTDNMLLRDSIALFEKANSVRPAMSFKQISRKIWLHAHGTGV